MRGRAVLGVIGHVGTYARPLRLILLPLLIPGFLLLFETGCATLLYDHLQPKRDDQQITWLSSLADKRFLYLKKQRVRGEGKRRKLRTRWVRVRIKTALHNSPNLLKIYRTRSSAYAAVLDGSAKVVPVYEEGEGSCSYIHGKHLPRPVSAEKISEQHPCLFISRKKCAPSGNMSIHTFVSECEGGNRTEYLELPEDAWYYPLWKKAWIYIPYGEWLPPMTSQPCLS